MQRDAGNARELACCCRSSPCRSLYLSVVVVLYRFEQLEQFALDYEDAQQHRADLGRQRQRQLSFHKLLKSFVNDSQLSGAYFLADMKNMMQLAKMLRHIEPYLGLADMYTCCISPASADDGPVVQVGCAGVRGRCCVAAVCNLLLLCARAWNSKATCSAGFCISAFPHGQDFHHGGCIVVSATSLQPVG